MENQQLSTFEERLRLLARNAKFGDGSLWQHPKCYNSKLIYSSTTPELLEVKRSIAPEIFTTGVVPITLNEKAKVSRFKNAKDMYTLASTQNPIFTEYKLRDKLDIFRELTLEDFALWYLDDGCCLERRDYIGRKGIINHRYLLCIGDSVNTELHRFAFNFAVQRVFNVEHVGRIGKNNSRATENNMNWFIPLPIAKVITAHASKYNVLPHKFPHGKSSETIRKE